MTMYETDTDLAPGEVIERARDFFARERSPYTAFPAESGTAYLRLALEVGEVMIGAIPREGATHVRASASRSSQLLARFLATLNPSGMVHHAINRHPR